MKGNARKEEDEDLRSFLKRMKAMFFAECVKNGGNVEQALDTVLSSARFNPEGIPGGELAVEAMKIVAGLGNLGLTPARLRRAISSGVLRMAIVEDQQTAFIAVVCHNPDRCPANQFGECPSNGRGYVCRHES